MKSLLEHFPNAIEQNTIRNILEIHKNCLVSFLMPKPYHEGKDCSVGSGFFVLSDDPSKVTVLTAKHVFDDFNVETGRITVDTHGFRLGKVGMIETARDVDFAQWTIPASELIRRGLHSVPALPILSATDAMQRFEPMSSFVVMGYPSSQNGSIDYRPGKNPDRSLIGLALHESTFDPQTGIRYFPFTGKTVPEAWRSDMTSTPSLRGISGSPCLRLVIERTSGRLSALLAGVFYAWNKQEQKIKVVSLGDPWEFDV